MDITYQLNIDYTLMNLEERTITCEIIVPIHVNEFNTRIDIFLNINTQLSFTIFQNIMYQIYFLPALLSFKTIKGKDQLDENDLNDKPWLNLKLGDYRCTSWSDYLGCDHNSSVINMT